MFVYKRGTSEGVCFAYATWAWRCVCFMYARRAWWCVYACDTSEPNSRACVCVCVCLPCYILTPISTGVCIYVNTTDLIVITLGRYEKPRDLKIKKLLSWSFYKWAIFSHIWPNMVQIIFIKTLLHWRIVLSSDMPLYYSTADDKERVGNPKFQFIINKI